MNNDSFAFLTVPRKVAGYRPAVERLKDYRPVEKKLPSDDLHLQATRCMDCGIPFCHSVGCPIENSIPEFNALVAANRWSEALAVLLETCPFPEFTSRICPAPCEGACVNGLDGDAVTIREIEGAIIDYGFESGEIRPHPPTSRNGKKVAIVGSGPAGLTAAYQLNQRGFSVTVYEAAAKPGGLLRYGIPDFKLDKKLVERRIKLMEAEGITFECNVRVGSDISASFLKNRFDAVLLACGARKPRDLPAPGRDLEGIHFALDFLTNQNQVLGGEKEAVSPKYLTKGKKVIVIGGGDTGSDCIGTSNRQGALSVKQLEIMPQPPEKRGPKNPWPQWPLILRESSSHKEGSERMFSLTTLEYLGKDGKLNGLRCAPVEWKAGGPGERPSPHVVKGSEFTLDADLVFLAMGFVGPEDDVPTLKDHPEFFACGDFVSGPSLVVRAMASGKKVAAQLEKKLLNGMGRA